MISAPRISVIVPARDASATLAECLDSLLGQTLRDLEVIVVDDGSTDGTATIAARTAATAPMPVRVVTRPPGGRAAARNTGLAEARGEFVGFVDADDVALPTLYERLLARADATGADLVLAEYESFHAETGETLYHYREGDEGSYGASVVERPSILLDVGASVCNKLVRRSLFLADGVTFPEGMDFEDLATAYRLAVRARRIEKVSEVLYRYRQGHASSVMSARDERYLQIPTALDITNRDFHAHGVFDALRAELEAVNVVHLILGRYGDLFRTGEAAVRHTYIDAAFRHLDAWFPAWRRSSLVRAMVTRPSKRVVSTHRALLRLYTDLTARGGQAPRAGREPLSPEAS